MSGKKETPQKTLQLGSFSIRMTSAQSPPIKKEEQPNGRAAGITMATPVSNRAASTMSSLSGPDETEFPTLAASVNKKTPSRQNASTPAPQSAASANGNNTNATMKKGGFRGGQHLAFEPMGRQPSATQIFDSFAKDIIMNGGYLNSDDLFAGLNDKIADLRNLHLFREIQGVNRVVHAAVMCYWQSRSIRIYSELEKFVIKQVAGYKRETTPPERFEEFGMGNLMRNDVVVKQFGFTELPKHATREYDLPVVTTSEVLQCMQVFLLKNRNLGRPDEQMEEKFMDHLRRYFGASILGVDIEFKGLFHGTTQARGAWFGELRTAKDKFAVAYKEAIQQALQRLAEKSEFSALRGVRGIGPPSSEAPPLSHQLLGDDRIYRAAKVDVRATLTTLNALGVTGAQEFLQAARLLLTQAHANANSRMGLAVRATISAKGVLSDLPVNALEQTALFVDASSGGAESVAFVQLCSLPAKKPRECLIASVVGLIAYLLAAPPSSNPAGVDALSADGEGDGSALEGAEGKQDGTVGTAVGSAVATRLAEAVRLRLGATLTASIPPKCRQALEELLRKLIKADEFFDIGVSAADGLPSNASVDWNSVHQRLEEVLRCDVELPVATRAALTRRRKKGGDADAASAEADGSGLGNGSHALRVGDYLGLVTAVVLFRRVLDTVGVSTGPSLLTVPNAGSTAGAGAGASLAAGATAEAVVTYIADCVHHHLTSTKGSAELTACLERYGPLVAFLTTLSAAEKGVNSQLCIPAFECTRLGGSFLHLLVHHLEQVPASAERASGTEGTAMLAASSGLAAALRTLQEAVFPKGSGAEADDSAADGVEALELEVQTVGAAAQGVTVEEALRVVQEQLGAVLTGLEFATPLDGTAAEGDPQPVGVLDWLLAVLVGAESRMSEALHGGGAQSDRALPGFLNLVQAVVSGSEELADRLRRLLQTHCRLSVGDQHQSEDGVSNAANTNKNAYQVGYFTLSPAMVEAAIGHYLRSDTCPGTFTSQQELVAATAGYLVDTLAVPSKDATQMATQAIAQLRTQSEPILALSADGSCIEVQRRVSSAGGRVVFPSPALVPADVDQDSEGSVFTEDLRRTLLDLLATAPLGVSCALHVMWNEYGYGELPLPSADPTTGSGGAAYPTVADFVLHHADTLAVLRPEAAYYHCPGTGDCFAVPFVAQTSGGWRERVTTQLVSALKRHDRTEAAAWLLSAANGWVDRSLVTSLLNSHTLQGFESYGADAVQRLCGELLAIALSLPIASGRAARSAQHPAQVLALCLDSLAFAAKVNSDTAQQCALDYARACPDRSVVRRLLAAANTNVGAALLPTLYARATDRAFVAEALRSVVRPGALVTDAANSAQAATTGGNVDKGAGGGQKVGGAGAGVSEGTTASQVTGGVSGDAAVVTRQLTGPATASSDKEAVILKLLETDFHYTDGGRTRPPMESPEGRKLQQALNLLAASLYSSQVHFVMELIQNADDNQYAANVTPTLRLQLFPHAVVVYNNEVGFSEANIVAVCNVNGSTKAQKAGYIGQKGIGFKSVFSVSDCPEIHSNGFHIKFDKKISMLEPVWVPATESCAWPYPYDANGTYYETCLRLTLDANALKNIAKLNQDIQEAFNGKLILFLNRLERMILEDRQRDVTVEYARQKLSTSASSAWVQIITTLTRGAYAATAVSGPDPVGADESFWLILRHEFAPQIHRLEVLPAQTEVSIAFKFAKTGRRHRAKALLARDAEVQRAALAAEAEALAEEALYSEQQGGTAMQPSSASKRAKSQRGATGTTGAEGGDGVYEQYVEEIHLDFSELLMPIYAYLPTSMCCFRFIVQGDFVLPTNRESILEQNDWNQSLFDKVPPMFASAVRELALWSAETEGGVMSQPDMAPEELAATFPMLSQLTPNAYYSLRIDAGDVLAVLPRRSHTSKDHVNRVISAMYEELQSVSFLRAQTSDALCTPKQLCTVHHLDFVPAEYLPEQLLYDATGLRYALNEPGEYELDEELTGPTALRIARLEVHHVVTCLEHLAQQLQSSTQGPSGAAKESSAAVLGRIAGALLLLDNLCQHNQQVAAGGGKVTVRVGGGFNSPAALASKLRAGSTAVKGAASASKSLVPAQTLKRTGAFVSTSTGTTVNASTSALLKGYLSEDVRSALRGLCIWPLEDNTFTSLASAVAFLSDGSKAFTPEQQECFSHFSHRVRMLSGKLLEAASACAPRGGEQLRAFLLENFRPVKIVGAVRSVPGRGNSSTAGSASAAPSAVYSGGVEPLNADVVLQRVILPAYAAFAEAQRVMTAATADAAASDSVRWDGAAGVTPELAHGLDRRTAAAFLAFFFHCKWSTKLNVTGAGQEYADFVRDVGVVVPVLTAKDSSNKGHGWDSPQLVLVRKYRPDQEFVAPGEVPTAGQLVLPSYEVHLGLELADSAVAMLSKTNTVTAFRQLHWRIVDPLVAALAFRNKSLRREVTFYTPQEVEAAFAGLRHSGGGAGGADELKNAHWPEFLLRLGMVNFFGVYAMARSAPGLVGTAVQYEAPFLKEYILHLQRNGRRVATSYPGIGGSPSHLITDGGADAVEGETSSEMGEMGEEAKASSTATARADAFLPLFLPDSADKVVRAVSKEVHETLVLVASLLAKELLPLVRGQQPQRLDGTLRWLRSTPWCPCDVSETVPLVQLNTDVTEPSGRQHLLAAPRDIFLVLEDDRRGPTVERSFLLPHCATVPRKLSQAVADLQGLQSVFGFHALGPRVPEEPTHVLTFLEWLTRQGEGTAIMSNVQAMVRLYQAVESYTLRGEETTAARYTATLARLLATDAPLVWIPSTLPAQGQAQHQPELSQYSRNDRVRESEAPYVKGRMVPLSKLVKSDPSNRFTRPDSPVKPLDLYYPPEIGAVVAGMFTRSVYCYGCQAREGMFGLHGCSGDALVTGPALGPQCVCRQGPFCGAITAKYGRPVRKSPSSADLVALLEQRCARFKALQHELSVLAQSGGAKDRRAASASLQAKKDHIQRVALEDEVSTVKDDIGSILTTLSSNVWKCFHIRYAVQRRHSLHPYSSAQLQTMQRLFVEKDLLPVWDFGGFVSAPPLFTSLGHPSIKFAAEGDDAGVGDDATEPTVRKQLIAVDDVGAFQMFSAELAALHKEVEWVEVHDAASSAVGAASLVSEDSSNLHSTSHDPYSLEDLQADETAFLQCSPAEFGTAVNFISPETFFAPTDRLALLEFLRIRKLSDSIATEWVTQEVPAASDKATARLFVTVMNHLLAFTHAYYYHGGSKEASRNSNSTAAGGGRADTMSTYNLHLQLLKTRRVQALLAMDITQCAVLERRLRLSLGSVVEERTVSELHHRVCTTGSNVLYLRGSASAEELQSLAVNLLLKVLRVELALIEVRQEPKEMEDLRKKLESVAKLRDMSKLVDRLEAFDLTVPEEAQDSAESWRLAVTERFTERAETTAVSAGEDAEGPDEATRLALEAYEKVQKQVRAKNAPASAGKVKESKLANEAKFAQFKKEQTLQMKAQGDLAAARVAGESSVMGSSEGAEAADAPAPIVVPEDQKVQLEQSERARSTAPTIVTGVRLGEHDGGEPSLPSTGPVIHLTVPDPAPPTSAVSALPQPQNGHRLGIGHAALAPALTPTAPAAPTDALVGNAGLSPPLAPPTGPPVAFPMPPRLPAADAYARFLAALPGHFQPSLGFHPPGQVSSSLGNPFGGLPGPLPSGLSPMWHPGNGHIATDGAGHSNGGVSRFNPFLAATLSPSAVADVIICEDFASVQAVQAAVTSEGAADLGLGLGLGQELGLDAGDSAALGTETTAGLRSNAVSGRLGEERAVAFLKAFRMRGELAFTEVTWVNQAGEVGLPYDILVTLPDGTQKFCEVKTRSVNSNHSNGGGGPKTADEEIQDFAGKQWAISATEVNTASHLKEAYFGMFLNVRVDYHNGAAPRLEQAAARLVGLERGLIHAIAADRSASLFVQMNVSQ